MHDLYLDGLCEKIEHDYDQVLKNVPLYSEKRRLVGEVDLLAIKGNKCDVYEVKCSYRFTKAKKQLQKIKKLLGDRFDVQGMFFFCGEAKMLVEI
jgi:hypothetical protein